MRDLSILIPARNEQFLSNTVDDILSNIEADTEIIVICDGNWPLTGIKDNPRVTLVYHHESIGQRAATNEAARLSSAKFIMKCDAHCAFDKGFDRKIMEGCEKDWTVIPTQYNLHVFDWKCKKCGHQTYMGPKLTTCENCKQESEFDMVVVWKPKLRAKSDYMRFDHNLHFQYWSAYKERPEAQGEIVDAMSLIGACWMMPRERYWELDGMDEQHGSWGQMGTEIACKSWLSGGRLVVNRRTWFAHMFRTRPGFGFPYKMSDGQVEQARAHSRQLWLENTWPKQIRPLSWMLEKFAPIPGWHDTPEGQALLKVVKAKGEEFDLKTGRIPKNTCRQPVERFSVETEVIIPSTVKKLDGSTATEAIRSLTPPAKTGLSKGIVYYTENRCPEQIFLSVQKRLKKCVNGHEIVSVSLKPLPVGFATLSVVMADGTKPGILTMFKQILAGLEACSAEIAFLCEHDVLYHPSHFEFTPSNKEVFYYNEHTYKVRSDDGQGVFYFTKQTSGLCAYRELLVGHYRRRVAKIEQNALDIAATGAPVKNDGYSRHMGFEPGCHMYPRGVDNYPAERWMSEFPNVDIRHGKNLTQSRWDPSGFRNPNACLGWKLVDEVPGWGRTKGRFAEFLAELSQ